MDETRTLQLQQLAPSPFHVARSPRGSRTTDLNLSKAALSAALHCAVAEWHDVVSQTPSSSSATQPGRVLPIAMPSNNWDLLRELHLRNIVNTSRQTDNRSTFIQFIMPHIDFIEVQSREENSTSLEAILRQETVIASYSAIQVFTKHKRSSIAPCTW